MNAFPVGENKDVLKPVKIDDSQISAPGKNNVKSATGAGIDNTTPVNKGDANPANKGPVKTENQGNISKGEMKPINTEPNIQKDSRSIPGGNYEPKTPNTQRNDISVPSQKPNTVTPKSENKPAPKPQYNKPDTEQQVNPRNENNRYQPPQRDYNYERSKETPTAPKSNNYQRSQRPSHENKGNAPQHKPSRQYAPKSESGPSHDVTPKSYDRGGSFQTPERSGSFDRGNVSPAPSNRSGGGSFEQSPSRSSGRPAPR